MNSKAKRTILSLSAASLVAFAALPAGSAGAAATRAEYTAQAEPICASASAEIRSLNKKARRSAKLGHDKTAGKTITRMGGVWSSSVNRVSQISPPPGEEATIARWLDLTSQIGSGFARMGRAHKHGRIGQRDAIYLDMQEIGTEAITLMRDWGMFACVGTDLPALGPLPGR